jgi:putative FmdB family regulatory protein
MPIYEYKCVSCTARWKEMHGADDKGGPCPQCGSQGQRRLPVGTTYTVTARDSTPGQRVEKFIEESREVLKEQLREARQEYKP